MLEFVISVQGAPNAGMDEEEEKTWNDPMEIRTLKRKLELEFLKSGADWSEERGARTKGSQPVSRHTRPGYPRAVPRDLGDGDPSLSLGITRAIVGPFLKYNYYY